MTERRRTVSRPLQTLLQLGAVGNLSDGELLDRYSSCVSPQADRAFEALLARHGGMVMATCRRMLDDPHDADDAFQATFLVLASRAKSIRGRDSLSSWLYGVALRVSSNARRARARRETHERKASRPEAGSKVDHSGPEVVCVITEELGRLPDRYRAAIVLCDLEGFSHEEAARRLGCPLGTIKSRQARGRDRLKGRLLSRGLAPSIVVLAVSSIAEGASHTVPAALADLTIKAALRIARGEATVGVGSAAVAALTKGTITAMFLTRLKVVSSIIFLLGTVSLGAGIAVRASTMETPQDPVAQPKPAPATTPGKSDIQVLREAAEAVRSSPDALSRFYALTTVALAQIRADDREGAKKTAREAAEIAKTIETNEKADTLVRASWTMDSAGDRDGATEVLQLAKKAIGAMPLERDQFLAWPLYITTRFTRGDKEEAKNFADHLRWLVQASKGQLAFTGRGVVESLSYIGDYPSALDAAENLSRGNGYTRGQLLGLIAHTAAELSTLYMQPRRTIGPEESKAALEVVRRIETMTEKIEFAEERPDCELALAFARLGDFEAALKAADRYGQGPVRFPNGIDLTAGPYILSMIGNAQGRAGRREDSRQTFQKALDIVQHDPKLATPLGQSRISQIAWGQVVAGDIEGALKTNALSPSEFRPMAFVTIAKYRAGAGDREGYRAAYQLALDALERKSQPIEKKDEPKTEADLPRIALEAINKRKSQRVDQKDDPKTEADLPQIIAIRARMGEPGKALELFASIKSENVKASAAKEIAKIRTLRGGDTAGVLAWALTLEPEIVRRMALYGLAEGFRAPSGPNDPDL